MAVASEQIAGCIDAHIREIVKMAAQELQGYVAFKASVDNEPRPSSDGERASSSSWKLQQTCETNGSNRQTLKAAKKAAKTLDWGGLHRELEMQEDDVHN